MLDAIPPFFRGELPLTILTAARNSPNRSAHDRDMFFADNPIGNRWLQLLIQRPRGASDPAGMFMIRNLEQFQAASTPGSYRGRDGVAEFLGDMCDRLDAGHNVADELFVVAGVALASTAVHADWVADTGQRLRLPGWTELARQISRLAYHWSALRILASLTRNGEVSVARLRGRRAPLLAELDRTLDGVATAAAVL